MDGWKRCNVATVCSPKLPAEFHTTWDLHGLLGRRAGSDHGGDLWDPETKKRKVFGAEKWMAGWNFLLGWLIFRGKLVSFREGTTYNFFFRIRDFSFDSSIFGMPSSFRWQNVSVFHGNGLPRYHSQCIHVWDIFPYMYHKNQPFM